MTSEDRFIEEQKTLMKKRFSNTESTKKGTTVDNSIGDDTLIGSVCKRSEAEDDKVPETVDGDPIEDKIKTEN